MKTQPIPVVGLSMLVAFLFSGCDQLSIVKIDNHVLFDGSHLNAWDFAEDSWIIDKDGSLTCQMEEIKDKNGKIRIRGKGDIVSKREYSNFELHLSYKLSDAANSGVFYWADKDDLVKKGFEIQLMDNDGFQREHGPRGPKKLSGSFYDGKAPSSHPANPVGQWDTMILRCEGSNVQVTINKIKVIDVDVSQWITPGMNPDGSKNKFKDALASRPRKGHIALQNHGQKIWFKDISIRKL